MSNKTAGAAEGLAGGIVNIYKNAAAANNAHAANEALQDAKDAANGKVHGAIYRGVESAADTFADAMNVATGGIWRKVGNLVDDKESKIDYKALKQANKAGEIDKHTSVAERAEYLVNDEVANLADDEPEP